MSEDKRFRKTPRQERSRSTVEAILEASARVIGAEGPANATTQQIAHLAGVSIGSLYQYFPGKEALFGALIERAIDDDLEAIRKAVDASSALSFVEGARLVLSRVLDLPMKRPRLYAWMIRYLPELGLLPASQRAVRESARETRRFLEIHKGALPPADLDAMALIVVGAVRGALEAVARERPELLENESFLDYMADLALGLLDRTAARAAGAKS
ncbi:TetR/AcrR family transcriptional regulator [Polyangium sp. 15x6]|uniref:TetR/AcrR family transcriptional regulator n=1 Tax=Polyangium sp. 15x6 TaxID=3042687 RepID=UPI00249B5315|nr:TetR/AcrR family transcriptional regulator [Polyangium sp. 15x6]MDI3286706.1 TetR/AcrR family transcriptional regulator [Polyangium sp. 15x6]